MPTANLSSAARALASAALAFGCAADAAADPRWWWGDRPLTAGIADARDPDIVAIPASTSGDERLAVVWQQQDTLGGSHIELTATFDGGCSWCPPYALTTDGGETQPSVAASIDAASFALTLQVAYQQGGSIWVVASDPVPFPWSCDGLAATAWRRTPEPLNLSDPNRPRRGSDPNLTSIYDDGCDSPFAHYHLVWEDHRDPLQSEIGYARDLGGDGDSWEEMYLLRDRSNVVGPSYGQPSVSADRNVFAPGASGVEVAFVETDTGRILTYRSVDAGDTFSATGVPPPAQPIGPPGQVGVASPGPGVRPSNDTGAGSCAPFPEAAWHAVGWASALEPSVDAEYRDSATTTDPPFGPLSLPIASTGLAPAVVVTPHRSDRGLAELWSFFESGNINSREVYFRPGVLRHDQVPAKDIEQYPIDPERIVPPDPDLSAEPRRLTSCQWDDTTGICDDVRGVDAGDARDVAAVDYPPRDPRDPPAIFVVWSDDRALDGGGTGPRNIWFKRTDRGGAIPSFGADDPKLTCTGPDAVTATVTVSPVPECPLEPEYIARYSVFLGPTLGGPFQDRVDVPGGRPGPFEVELTGLVPAETYALTLLAEDEARNITPSTFDPGSANNIGFDPDQQQLLTTPTCAPAIEVDCLVVNDTCPGDGRPADGSYEPGELVTLRLTLTNYGNLEAEELAAEATAIGASLLEPAVRIPSLDLADAVTVDLHARIDPAILCGAAETVDIDLTNLRTSLGPLDPSQSELVSCDLTTPGPGEPCSPCSTAPCPLHALAVETAPLLPPRVGDWVYTAACAGDDPRLEPAPPRGRVALPAGVTGLPFDSGAPGPPHTLTLYQLGCDCATELRITKEATGALVLR